MVDALRSSRGHPLRRLFDPASVAIIGASPRGDSVGGHLTRKLTERFAGTTYLVNPRHREIGGRPCLGRAQDLPAGVDLAVIATPARAVPGVLEDCAAGGIRHAVVISAGFGEAGRAGLALQSRALDVARMRGIRLVGPNCVGLQRPSSGLDASFLRGMPPAGRLGLVSQSGAICSAVVDWAGPNGLGFSSVISLGNAADIDFGEAIAFLASDPETDAILLYVESVRDARRFVSALRTATHVKPVIVLKSGRGTAAAAAARTHTGALLGSDAAFDAALERGGGVRVETFGQLFAAAEMLAAGRRARGDRLGIVTNGGGAGVLAADRAERMGVRLPAPSSGTVAALDAVLPPHWSRGNPMDVLGDAPPEAFEAAIRAGLADTAFDGLLVMLVPQAVTDASEVARRAVELTLAALDKPVLFCWMGEASVNDARRLISAAKLPDFTTPERAAEAFAFLARHERSRRLAQEVPGPRATAEPDEATARRIVSTALDAGRTMLSDAEAKAVLHAFGVPVGETRQAATPEAAVRAAEALGWPVAVKVDSLDISHKSDVGGVCLDVADASELCVAFAAVMEAARVARPAAAIRGVTVEPMARVRDGRELLVGASCDPVFGPVIAFGAGGTMVELLHDSAVALPPLTEVLAERLVGRTRVAPLLDRFRQLAPVDRSEIIDVLLRVSDLVERLPEIVALDINPLLAGPDGVLALDVRIEIVAAAARSPGDHLCIAPYPRSLGRRMRLPDGRSLLVRPIRPEDAAQEQAFVRSLSAETRRSRFLGTLKALTPHQLARFTQIDYASEMALVALIEGEDGAMQVGVARHALGPDERVAEFAIVVAEVEWGQGIGTRLMELLMAAARGQGATRMVGDVLAENRPMRTLMAKLGFDGRPDPDDPSMIRVRRDL